MPPTTYQDVIRRNLKRLREAQGLRQDQLAETARSWGLNWSQGTIAGIETGRRLVSAGEEKLLMSLLSADKKQPVTLRELLQADDAELIDVDGVLVEGADLRSWAEQKPFLFIPQIATHPAEPLKLTAAARRETSAISRRYRLPDDPQSLSRLFARSLGVTTQKAARSLGIKPEHWAAFEIEAAAESLWGRSLRDERDDRAADLGIRARDRAALGHVTRQLLQELEAHIRTARKRGGRKK